MAGPQRRITAVCASPVRWMQAFTNVVVPAATSCTSLASAERTAVSNKVCSHQSFVGNKFVNAPHSSKQFV